MQETTKLISLREAASRWGISVKTLRRRITDGELTAYRSGQLIRVKTSDVDAMFQPMPTQTGE